MKVKSSDMAQPFSAFSVQTTMGEKVGGRNICNISGRLRFVYNFNTRSLLTFEENLKYKCNVPMTAYIDFETTAPTDDYIDPESRKMFAASYVIIFAFHPDLSLDHIIIERSFEHS